MNFENFIKRLKRRTSWFLSIVIACIISYFVGKKIIENFSCPEFQITFLIFINVFIAVIGLIWAMMRKSVATIWKILSVLVIFCAGVGVPFLLGEVIAQTDYVKMQFCPEVDLEYLDLVYELLEEDHLEAAEDTAHKCIEYSVSREQELECEEALGKVLLAQMDELITSVEDNQYDGSICEILTNKIDQMDKLAIPGKGGEELKPTFNQIIRRQEIACREPTPIPPTVAPTLTPTLVANFEIELIRTMVYQENFVIDFRVYKDNQQIRDLTENDFQIAANNKLINFSNFENRATDDPVCILAVVDNSGSIYDGLEDIKIAIDVLNAQRKPDDLVGLIVFSSPAEIRIQSLGEDQLDRSKIDAKGKLTAIWHAVNTGLNSMIDCPYETKYLILLTDGDNNIPFEMKDNNTNARELHDMALNMKVNVCPIGIESDKLNTVPLELLSTNCSYTTAENFESVSGLFMNIFGYVRDFYRITIPRAGNENIDLFIEYIVNDDYSITEGIGTNGEQ